MGLGNPQPMGLLGAALQDPDVADKGRYADAGSAHAKGSLVPDLAQLLVVDPAQEGRVLIAPGPSCCAAFVGPNGVAGQALASGSGVTSRTAAMAPTPAAG
jgi:hypothetical protein